jgi:hypothetical protein
MTILQMTGNQSGRLRKRVPLENDVISYKMRLTVGNGGETPPGAKLISLLMQEFCEKQSSCNR